MTALTIQQAIFISSKLRAQLDNATEKFRTEFRVPIALNNKSIVTEEKNASVHETIGLIESLKSDISNLKTAVHRANCNAQIEFEDKLYTPSELLESLKIERNIVNMLEDNISFGYGQERIKAVAGVGIVEEGIVDELYVRSYIEQLESSANNKSMLIDRFNNEYTIEVALNNQI
ncbi:hypothetical protein BHU61_04545 [Macrococcus epidermidis]|uniref:Uncharacterized protein n=1 Tax=Macrococcus epidermidis TaxID=1902580 RepID=A0A327ZWZ5_9STAP|nr:hypothetical protein [Macrococcus epidermidis]RAK46735.1 hypothetical protein BHU61_04545 [Macrococcus epidermidis]